MSAETLTAEYPWLPLASRALAAARRDDMPLAERILHRILREHGPEVIPAVVISWIDAVLVTYGWTGPDSDLPAGVAFVDAKDGMHWADDPDVPAEAVWSGRLMAARANGDRESMHALIEAAMTGPDATDESWGGHVLAALEGAAMTLNAPPEVHT